MAVSYKRVAYGGLVVGVNRLVDGIFDINFGVPPAGASAAVLAEYRQNEHYRRYEADVAAGVTVASADPAPVPPPAPDFGADLPADFDQQVADAVTQLRQYLALSTPTPAQDRAALRLLIRGLFFILRRLGL